jgi:hypothetical protein
MKSPSAADREGKARLVHPWLLAVYPPLFLYVHNITASAQPSEAFLLSVFMLAGAFLAHIALTRVTRNRIRAGLIVAVLVSFVCNYGHASTLIWKVRWHLFGIEFGRHKLLLPVWFLLHGAAVLAALKVGTEQGIRRLSRALDVVAVVLVLQLLASLVFASGGAKPSLSGTSDTARVNLSLPEQAPDVFYLVFDRYADSATLRERYSFDNGPFLRELRTRGFFIPARSLANYPRTSLSLASSLNFMYLDDLARRMNPESEDYQPVNRSMEDHRLGRILRRLGYRHTHVGSWYIHTNHNRFADRNLHGLLISEYLLVFYKFTLVYPLGLRLGWFGEGAHAYEHTLRQLDQLAKMQSGEAPEFVFAHFNLPHPPFVFDRNGEFVESRPLDSTYYDGYIEQLRYTNKRILELVDTLSRTRDVPPVIVLQSDEGPFSLADSRAFPDYSWSEGTVDEWRKKLGILNALRIPGVPDSLLCDTMTPVNTFRIVLNTLFGASFELLPDRMFMVPDETHPYRMFEITDRLEQAPVRPAADQPQPGSE